MVLSLTPVSQGHFGMYLYHIFQETIWSDSNNGNSIIIIAYFTNTFLSAFQERFNTNSETKVGVIRQGVSGSV